MPKDCKRNKYQDCVYEPTSRAYGHRRDQELTNDAIMALYNCGNLDRPSPNCGMY